MKTKHVHEYWLGKSGKVIKCDCGKFRFICECCHEVPESCGCLGPAQIEIITLTGTNGKEHKPKPRETKMLTEKQAMLKSMRHYDHE